MQQLRFLNFSVTDMKKRCWLQHWAKQLFATYRLRSTLTMHSATNLHKPTTVKKPYVSIPRTTTKTSRKTLTANTYQVVLHLLQDLFENMKQLCLRILNSYSAPKWEMAYCTCMKILTHGLEDFSLFRCRQHPILSFPMTNERYSGMTPSRFSTSHTSTSNASVATFNHLSFFVWPPVEYQHFGFWTYV